MLASVVYVLCGLTSVACAALLVRGYVKSRSRLLLWSSLCFVGFAVQNSLLFVDLTLTPGIDLSLWRDVAGLTGLAVLLFGLLWETE